MYDLALVVLPDTVLENPKMYFPLGVLYVAASAREQGYDVVIVDMRDGEKDLPQARYYGFSCTTPQINKAKELAHKVKGKTIVGGPHPTLCPSDCIDDFDYIASGEGEDIIIDILAGKSNKFIIGRDRIRRLDNIPYPAWDMVEEPFSEQLFPGERYGTGEKAATLIASRGCPFDCAFCGNLFRKPVVYRSVNNIIGELKELISRGIRYFRFEDDNFTTHPDLQNLCIDVKALDIKYKCHTRSKLMTQDKARMLAWSGCEECGLGVESADDNVLRIVNKGETTKHHAEAIFNIKKAGIRSKVYLISGLPGETDDSAELTKEFVRIAKPDKWTLSTFTPYPGCTVFTRPLDYGVHIVDWDYSNWWNFCQERFVHHLEGQTQEQMWNRYRDLYEWLKEGKWQA